MNDLIIGQHIQRRRKPSFAPLKGYGAPSPRRGAPRSFKMGDPRPAFLKRIPGPLLLLAAAALPLIALLGVVCADAVSLDLAERDLAFPVDSFHERTLRSYAATGSLSGSASDSAELPPIDLAETLRFDSYVVRKGDTLAAIAAKRGLSLGSLIAANRISDIRLVHSGMTLRIPNMDGVPYTVRKGDSIQAIAARWSIPIEAVLDANDLESANIQIGMSLFLPGARLPEMELRQAMGNLFAYPIRGVLTSTFGWREDPFTGARRFHVGIDLAAPLGTPIKAAQAGTVAFIGYDNNFGKYVILSHADGFQSLYGHMSEYRTVKGKRVAAGEIIGEVGSTGYSTGCHVHLSIFKNGRAVDPLRYLGKR